MKSNSAAKPRKFRPTPISPRTLRRMKERVELMRWSSHETDDEIRPPRVGHASHCRASLKCCSRRTCWSTPSHDIGPGTLTDVRSSSP